MGLDAHRRTPCGFCFVSYFTRKDAEAAVKYINGSMMDGRAIRVDHDWGFVEGRQFGRGRSGGQVGHHIAYHTAKFAMHQRAEALWRFQPGFLSSSTSMVTSCMCTRLADQHIVSSMESNTGLHCSSYMD